jgi:hypothetical protein
LADASELPASVQLNAYSGDGETVSGAMSTAATRWSLRTTPLAVERTLRPPEPADPKNWQDPRVGWGLVTFEQPGFSAAQYAANDDLCPALKQLLAHRGNDVVLRFRPQTNQRFTLLRDYRNGKDIDIAAAPVGTASGSIPRYLLLIGAPNNLPWSIQYVLSANRCVGRLPFHPGTDGERLSRYVNACLADWRGQKADTDSTLVWAVDHNPHDITHLMRNAIVERVYAKYSADQDLKTKASRLVDADATHGRLIDALNTKCPGLVVTTSHGMTGPLQDRDKMASQLGLPVDQKREVLQLSDLVSNWQPSGTLWYSHACCGAGADDGSLFVPLFEDDTPARSVLAAVGELGAQVAPLPLALLSAKEPARGFLGFVEPTFDWTLKQPATEQFLTAGLVNSLYDELYLGSPIGHAFRGWFAGMSTHYAAWDAGKRAYDGAESAKATLLYHNLAARNLQTLVFLGDPAVRLTT